MVSAVDDFFLLHKFLSVYSVILFKSLNASVVKISSFECKPCVTSTKIGNHLEIPCPHKGKE